MNMPTPAVLQMFLVGLLFALLAGCGGQENAPQQQATTSYLPGGYFNGGTVPASLTFDDTSEKRLDLKAGDSVDALPVRAAIPVRGCLASPTPDIAVCWETDDLRQPADQLIPAVPAIVSVVERVIGPTGAVDILVAHPGTTIYTGYYNNGPSGKRTVVVTATDDSRTTRIIVGHELAHAAYQQAGGDLTQVWLNESVATLVEAEMGWIRAIPQPGRFNNSAFTAKPVDEMDYYRSQQIGLLLKKHGTYPLGDRVSRKNPVREITGMEPREFAKEFWREQIARAPLADSGKLEVPVWGAVLISAPASGPDVFERISP